MLRGFIVLGVATAWAGVAQAQAQAPTGPATGGKRLAAVLTAGASYDSNLAGGNQQVAQVRDIEPEDITYSATELLTANLPLGRQAAFLSASATERRHQKNSNLDGEDFLVTAGFLGKLGKCGGTASFSYSRQQTLPTQLVVLVAKNIVDQRTYLLGGGCVSGHISANVLGQEILVDNQQKSAGLRDSKTKSISAGVGYGTDIAGTLQLSANYSEVEYGDAVLVGVPGGSGFHQYGGGLNYSRKIGRRLSGTLNVGFTKVDSDDPGASFSATTADAALQYAFSQRLHFSLRASRAVNAADLVNANSVLANSLDFSGNYRLSKRLTFSAGVSDTRSEYRGGIPSPLTVTNDESKSAYGSISMELGRTATISLDAAHSHRRSNVALFTSSSDHIGINLTKRF